MSDGSKIEWTDASWNPIRARNKKTGKVGWHCEHATTGCEFCYSESFNKRLGTGLPFKPGHRNDIELFLDDQTLLLPLRWKRPRRIFVCSMTDLFADFVPDEWIDKVFAVMALCPQHTFQVLTKRAERMRAYCSTLGRHHESDRVSLAMKQLHAETGFGARGAMYTLGDGGWHFPNIWLGVSCERQQEADERIPHLLQTPAAVRFISAEPLLGPIDLTNHCNGHYFFDSLRGTRWHDDPEAANPSEKYAPGLDWVIVGGESGRGARPMHPDWPRKIIADCDAAGVPKFFKQWGEWSPRDVINVSKQHALCGLMGSEPHIERDWLRAADFLKKIKGVRGTAVMARVGKKTAGRLLDGREHNDFPDMAPTCREAM